MLYKNYYNSDSRSVLWAYYYSVANLLHSTNLQSLAKVWIHLRLIYLSITIHCHQQLKTNGERLVFQYQINNEVLNYSYNFFMVQY